MFTSDARQFLYSLTSAHGSLGGFLLSERAILSTSCTKLSDSLLVSNTAVGKT